MARLVIRRLALIFRGDDFVPFQTERNLLEREVEIGRFDDVFPIARRPEGRLVDEIADIGAGKARGRLREFVDVDVGTARDLFQIDLKDIDAPSHGRPPDGNVAVEPAGPHERGVEHVGTVCRRHDHNGVVLVKAVHLAEDLIERLLAFVLTSADAGAALTSDGVDFVDKEDRGRVFLGGRKEVAHAARADADEHLNEFGAVNGEEGHVRFARHGAREQRFAGSRRAEKERSFGNARAHAFVFLRVL